MTTHANALYLQELKNHNYGNSKKIVMLKLILYIMKGKFHSKYFVKAAVS